MDLLLQLYPHSQSGGYIAITLSIRPSVHTFVTDISASTGRNYLIFDIWLWHGDLYRVSPFQVYRTSTSCLLCDLQMNEWGYFQHDVACNILFNIDMYRSKVSEDLNLTDYYQLRRQNQLVKDHYFKDKEITLIIMGGKIFDRITNGL